MTRTIPFFAETATATITIDGVTYRVPLIDSAGHLQVDVVTSTLPSGAATSANQDTMITALQLIDDLRGALAAVAADQLRTDVISSALPSGAATSAKQDTMITALQLIDDLRGALAAVAGDRLNVNVKATGASEVLAVRRQTSTPSTTRATVVTPTNGKAIRIISVMLHTNSATAALVEVYFGTGVNITSTAGKEIAYPAMVIDATRNWYQSWPDGGGPVGAVDDVLSLRTSADVGTGVTLIAHYREE